MDVAEIQQLLKHLTPAERQRVDQLLAKVRRVWRPLPGPQLLAYRSEATIIGFGGAAGGGKSDLACGKALTQHRKTGIFRREGTELTAIIDRLGDLLGSRDGLNGKDKIWRLPGNRQIEFGSVPNLGDERKYQGRPHDLLVFDEATSFLEVQVRFLLGWLRSTEPTQRCQALLTFNPPTSTDGQWVITFFAPWLDRKHPRPAKPGELRWFAMIDGAETEIDDARPFVLRGKHRVYTFTPAEHAPDQIITPQSRTFIPSKVSDNPFLLGTNYVATLQALPEPLRSQMLLGDFQAGLEDNAMQVIPTDWVDRAMARWKTPDKLAPMDSLGVDVARGGRDHTILARRHGMWFAQALVYAGSQTPDGPQVAGLTMAALRDRAPIHLDVIGVGASPYDFLVQARQDVYGINVAEASDARDVSGRLRFANIRTQLWWRMREALDPAANTGIALPPDRQLRLDLCAPMWRLRGPIIEVESREDIIKRIGRSPDWASAYLLALMDTPKRHAMAQTPEQRGEYNPLDNAADAMRSFDRDYDPLDHALR